MCKKCFGNTMCRNGCTSRMGPPTDTSPTKEEKRILALEKEVALLTNIVELLTKGQEKILESLHSRY